MRLGNTTSVIQQFAQDRKSCTAEACIVGCTALVWHRDGFYVQVRTFVCFSLISCLFLLFSLKEIDTHVVHSTKNAFYPHETKPRQNQTRPHFHNRTARRNTGRISENTSSTYPWPRKPAGKTVHLLGPLTSFFVLARDPNPFSTGHDPLHTALAPSCYQQAHIRHLPAIPKNDISRSTTPPLASPCPFPAPFLYTALVVQCGLIGIALSESWHRGVRSRHPTSPLWFCSESHGSGSPHRGVHYFGEPNYLIRFPHRHR